MTELIETLEIGKVEKKQLRKPLRLPTPLTTYRNEGHDCNLIKRKGMLGLFEMVTDAGNIVSYEIIRIQTNKKKEFAPDAESFYRLGKSYTERKYAEEEFDQMSSNF